jgi:hypothetical protein
MATEEEYFLWIHVTTVEELLGEVFSVGLHDPTVVLLGEVLSTQSMLRCFK